MYKDMLGNTRAKLGLHIHTTLSDGRKTPEEAAEIYKKAGYDAVAFTDHWVYGQGQTINGLTVLSGCEYHFGGYLGNNPVYHIVGIGMERDPLSVNPTLTCNEIPGKTPADQGNDLIEAVKKAGGLAFLGHPAWSINTPEDIRALKGLEGVEIYNTVSDCGMSNRPYSGCVVDMLAKDKFALPLLAVDDVHYYENDACVSYVMAEVNDLSKDSILNAIRNGKFYATQGPEVHLSREGDKIKLLCSPASKIIFMTNRVWAVGRILRGEDITKGEYNLTEGETFVRAEVYDADGRCAWSNVILV